MKEPWRTALIRGAYEALLVFALTTLLVIQSGAGPINAAIVGGINALAMLAARSGVEAWVDARRVLS